MEINHPQVFKQGTRVLLLKSRHKDGWIGKERAITRITHDEAHFDEALAELRTLQLPAERIYSSASPRDIMKAAREFNRRYMDACLGTSMGGNALTRDFHQRLPHIWASCLMQHLSVAGGDPSTKYWMWDCDTLEVYQDVKNFVSFAAGQAIISLYDVYEYKTKTGWHVLVPPFNRDFIGRAGLKISPDMNPLILWGWK